MRQVDQVTDEIVDAALKLHRGLGPGLLESVYSVLLGQELVRRGLHVERNLPVTFEYDGLRFDRGLRVDLLVERIVVVELKSVERLAPVHAKQIVTYMRLLRLPVGLLINFGGETLKEGLHRVVNRYVPGAGSPLRINAAPGGAEPGPPHVTRRSRE
jgi:iron complex transport system substrate-binding protein